MGNKKDDLGNRMKMNYENRFRYLLPRRTNIIIRIDGKAFHTFTKGLDRPIDIGLTDDMNETAKFLCENVQGAKFGYVQSDEISILITDYDDINTDAWFDYNLQKMCSISASIATAKFNQLRLARAAQEGCANASGISSGLLDDKKIKLAMFDARVFVIPEEEEVVNYFVWRQQDATRNSISMAAQSMFSHKQLQGKKTTDMQDMMMIEKGVNWNNYPIGFKRGRSIKKRLEVSPLVAKLELLGMQKMQLIKIQNYEAAAAIIANEKLLLSQLDKDPDAKKIRKYWEIIDPPIFTQDREFIKGTMHFHENELFDKYGI